MKTIRGEQARPLPAAGTGGPQAAGLPGDDPRLPGEGGQTQSARQRNPLGAGDTTGPAVPNAARQRAEPEERRPSPVRGEIGRAHV